MGNFFARVIDNLSRHFAHQDSRILMLGLDAAGKTTILYKFKLGEVVTTIPTIGFNVEEVSYKNITFRVFDVGGQEIIRRLWRHYFTGTDGLIFVVDSADPERIQEAAEELQKCVSDPLLDGCPVLIYANKQDLPNAMNINDMVKQLELPRMTGREWYVQSTVSITGEGLYEGLDWFAAAVKKFRKS